jgi:hypothetical protein
MVYPGAQILANLQNSICMEVLSPAEIGDERGT